MPSRTSRTHPLEIDAMSCGAGTLGMTLCPGKQADSNFGSPWKRDLDLDLSVIVDWGATTLVSLMEDHEFPMLQVSGLGDAAEQAGLEWHHLPIRDVDVPDERFERLWAYSGHVLRRKLKAGERIVLHCRGGLGRTGTIAARLAVEFGATPEEALRRVRLARRGTVETASQEDYVLRQQPVAADETYADRVLGCLLGGAVGDALGYAVEFSSLSAIREWFGPDGIREPVLNEEGKAIVSDDTQMTLFTGEGVLRGFAVGVSFEQADVLEAVREETLDWYAMQRGQGGRGRLSKFAVLAKKRHPGKTCKAGCARGADGTPEQPINDSKGCGGVMRVAPIGLCRALDGGRVFELAARSAAQTHGHPSGYLSAGLMAAIVRDLLDGSDLDLAVLRAVREAGAWSGARETIRAVELAQALATEHHEDHAAVVPRMGEGWVGEQALAIGLYSALVADDFAEAVCIASNHGGDSDSTASIAGQIYGTWNGVSAIPHSWVCHLDTLDPLLDVAGRTIAAGTAESNVE